MVRNSAAVRCIGIDEALCSVEQYGLSTVRGSWHYSWDLKRFYDKAYIYERAGCVYVFHPKPIHAWAPAPLFSNDETLDTLIGQKGKEDCPYWFLKLTDFETFLRRRSAITRKPHQNFPSAQSYQKVAQKLKCRLLRHRLSQREELFRSWFDSLKDPRYAYTSSQCVKDALQNIAGAPREWFTFYGLIEEDSGACKAVALTVDDGRSVSGVNMASERSTASYGTFFLVEMIKDLCAGGYSSFDCGVSGRYGTYKEKIYLDVIPVDSSGLPPFIEQSAIGFSRFMSPPRSLAEKMSRILGLFGRG